MKRTASELLPALRGLYAAEFGVLPRLWVAGDHKAPRSWTVATIDELRLARLLDGEASLSVAADAYEIPEHGLVVVALSKEDAARKRAQLLGNESPRVVEPVGWARLAGKIAIVTGSAQGFGEGIARELARAGASVVIADLNKTLADQVAEDLNASFGDESALSVAVDVGDEASVEELVRTTVENFGGLDLFVSNAGVLRAGGLEDMDLASFEFVTRINYTAFYLCTKHAARPMRLTRRYAPACWFDIVQINSKSGLEGSERNFAYAGGKFGGIGLTASFAKELVHDGIKVNAVCPGNYYEGPLWSDPEKGLFVQYLAAGKVPGAQTVEEVYEAYVAKVPMHKGCSPLDVARAIFYLIEQENETGQALPVTGGQIMLH